MSVRCPECSSPVPAQAVETSLGVAQCPTCEAVFETRSLDRPAPTAVLEVPRGLVEQETVSELIVRYRWLRGQHFFLAVFATFWNGFLVFWYTMAVGTLGDLGMASILMFLFPILHVAVGISIAYTVLAGFLNRTEVRVTGHGVTVRHGPLPWFGDVELAGADVAGLFLAPHTEGTDEDSSPTWDLKAKLTTGDERVLCEGLDDLSRGRYLAQRIGGWLRLEGRAESAEVRTG